MDPLSDILTLLKPQSYLTACLDAGGDWALRSDSGAGVIKCYAVTGGACWLRVEGVRDDMPLHTGDCIILPAGAPFTLASDLSLLPVPAQNVLGQASPGGLVVHNGGGDFLMVGTRFVVDARKARALLGMLPNVLFIRGAEGQAALRWSIEQMMSEMRDGAPGSALASHHLAHLMLLQAFRLYLSRAISDQPAVLHALADPHLAKAIGAMHARPAYRWTLAELANQAGMSRSIFAQRFQQKVGETPIAYLTGWRMMLAAEHLAQGEERLAAIARSCGYESENAFNTAFKRLMGCSPGRYARLQRAPMAS